jgi:hypothetical protein
MMDLAQQYLPAESIIGYELGNEVRGRAAGEGRSFRAPRERGPAWRDGQRGGEGRRRRPAAVCSPVAHACPEPCARTCSRAPQPEFWPTSVGGYDPRDNTTWIGGFDAYAAYYARVATALNPCAPGSKPILAGPGWGNVNTIDASWLATQAKAPGARCYMRELSVHVSGGARARSRAGAIGWGWRMSSGLGPRI